MIGAHHLKKSFGEIEALKDVTLTIRDGEVFGLVGTNGAGKSTLLRILSDVLRPDAGFVEIDSHPLYDDPSQKKQIFFVPDDAYYFPNARPLDMGRYYQSIYPDLDWDFFLKLLKDFDLDWPRSIESLPKGKKKQLFLLMGIASQTRYLLCDETFDGLDPVVRKAVGGVIRAEQEKRTFTPVIASHNLRELEHICDHVGLLYRGDILLSEDLEYLQKRMQKVQCLFTAPGEEEGVEEKLKVRSREKSGRLMTYTVLGRKEEVEEVLSKAGLPYYEILPISLEEVFLTETEAAGYDITKFLR